jgi:ribonuclease VapC
VTIAPEVVVDSSAIVAIFRNEADAHEMVARLSGYRRRVISAATWLEAAMVCEGKEDLGGGATFDRIVAALALEIAPVDAEQVRIGRTAFIRFGKGRHAKASLSYGDCFAYALAKHRGVPLLFKGNDFANTDIEPA